MYKRLATIFIASYLLVPSISLAQEGVWKLKKSNIEISRSEIDKSYYNIERSFQITDENGNRLKILLSGVEKQFQTVRDIESENSGYIRSRAFLHIGNSTFISSKGKITIYLKDESYYIRYDLVFTDDSGEPLIVSGDMRIEPEVECIGFNSSDCLETILD